MLANSTQEPRQDESDSVGNRVCMYNVCMYNRLSTGTENLSDIDTGLPQVPHCRHVAQCWLATNV